MQELAGVRSIDRIKLEIDHGNTDLKSWVNQNFLGWFESTNQQDVIGAYGKVMTWTQAQTQYSAAAQAEFARGADGWLIAHASAKRYVVVTEEHYDPFEKKKIKIPNVCRAANVPCINTFKMLHETWSETYITSSVIDPFIEKIYYCKPPNGVPLADYHSD